MSLFQVTGADGRKILVESGKVLCLEEKGPSSSSLRTTIYLEGGAQVHACETLTQAANIYQQAQANGRF